ncbi:MAG: hypothetical protein QNJ11_13655 [Woeseiaceae bacterium]|nr:hypothetical protein [Woeseiaceae bacterium]
MKFKAMIAAIVLSLALPVTAQADIVQKAYEVALSNVRLPRTPTGTIALKECDRCDYVVLRVGADTLYRLDGKPVRLSDFRAALARVADRDGEAVTVLHHLERNQVTEVSVNL